MFMYVLKYVSSPLPYTACFRCDKQPGFVVAACNRLWAKFLKFGGGKPIWLEVQITNTLQSLRELKSNSFPSLGSATSRPEMLGNVSLMVWMSRTQSPMKNEP